MGNMTGACEEEKSRSNMYEINEDLKTVESV